MDVWISIGSTYSYLTVNRIEDAAAAAGVTFTWRILDVRTLTTRQNNVPFATKPAKLAYMWRDLGRRAAARGLSPRLPAPYPLADLARANRVALVGLAEGWGPGYVRATYRRWFEDGAPAGEEPNLSASLAELGLDPGAVLARADAEDVVAALARATDTAEAAGIFGVPSFVVAGELFWGDDRLEDALAHAVRA